MILVLDRPSARAAVTYSKFRARRNSAHHADQRHPGEGEQDAEQDPEIRLDHSCDDDQEVKLRDARPDFDKALEEEVGPAAEIALHRAGCHSDDRGEDRQHQTEQHREAEAVDHAGDHVAPLVIGAEPVPFEGLVAWMEAALDRELAVLIGEQPGGLDREGHRRVLVLRVVGEADRWPKHPAALVDHLLDDRIAVVGLSLEDAPERGLGIRLEDRPIGLPLVSDEDRLVVGDELSEQADDEKRKKDPQAPIAAPIGLEDLPAAALERREPGPCARNPLGCDLLDESGIDRSVHAELTPRASRNRCADRPRYK